MKLAIVYSFCIKVAYAQYYNSPYYNYQTNGYNSYYPTPVTAAQPVVPAYLPTPTYGQTYHSPPPTPTFGPPYRPTAPPTPSLGQTYTNSPPVPTKQLKPPKRSITTPKSSPPTATAYFLSAPNEKIKATVLPTDKKETSLNSLPHYSCPLCNNFADVPLNAKILPPPPVGSPVLPGILDEIPTIVIPKDLTIKDTSSILSAKKPLFSDMYEKHKFPKNLRFDQELLEGFLTGLGITL